MMVDPRDYIKNDKKIPNSMAGDAGKSLIVNPTEDSYEHQVVGAVTNLTGQVIMWPLDTPPADYLMCNGLEYDTATYPALSALLGESSPGVFTVPNVVFPKNSFGSNTLEEQVEQVGTHGHGANAVGNHIHPASSDSRGNHTHPILNEVLSGGSGYWKVSSDPGGEQTPVNPAVTATSELSGNHGHIITVTGAGGHTPVIQNHTGTNQPACTLLNFCIKT